MLFAAHIKAGRAIIKMSQLELAQLTGLSINTIKNLENDEDAAKNANSKTIRKIKEILEEKGVKFLFSKNSKDTMDGIGVRLYSIKENDFDRKIS